jgi:hypothetical protein
VWDPEKSALDELARMPQIIGAQGFGRVAEWQTLGI